MPIYKKKFVRNIIKLGNSKAVTFPQEWTEKAGLKEKTEVSMYPINDKTILIVTHEEEEKRILKITPFTNNKQWSINLIKQSIISAFKLNVDEIYIKYVDKENLTQKDDFYRKLYTLLKQLRQEIIGFDFNEHTQNKEFFITFLLDTSKKSFLDIVKDLASVFKTIIENIVEGAKKKDTEIKIRNYDLILEEIDRKYSLGTRILITGLSEYHGSKGYQNPPIIRFLGNRVILIYTRDFINESLRFQELPTGAVSKYADIIMKIPELIFNLIENFDNINEQTISEFQEYLEEIQGRLKKIEYEKGNDAELQIRNIIKHYLNGYKNFFDIGITRMIDNMLEI